MISVAMIVRNEEKNLRRCLESVKNLADEIVIVDTGSTDSTIAIAREYTDKVFEEPWENNFSKHRNTSFSYCTGEWILQIDADEEFYLDPDVTPKDFKLMLQAIKPEINAVAMTLRDWSDAIKTFAAEVDIPRIFRAGQVTFKRRVHNEPVYEGITGFLSKCWLKHYGYNLSPNQQLEKAKRTIGLLEQSLVDDPEDHILYFYLAQAELKFANNSDKALSYAIEYHNRKDKIGKEFNTSVIHLIASVCIRQTKYKTASKFISEGLKENPNDVDLAWDLMTLGINTKNNQLTLAGAEKYIHALEAFSKNRNKSGMIGTQFYFHIDPHSQAAANYWFAILHLEIGIVTMRKMLAFAKENCKKHVCDEIESRLKADMEKLNLIDKLQSRIILPDNGVFNGDRGHYSVGGRR